MRTKRMISAILTSLVLAGQLSTAFAGGGNLGPVGTPRIDWSKAVVESTIQRYPTAESLKGWGYAKSLYLYGEYLVYLRTGDKRYLNHIRSWIDLHIDDQGMINRPINALDYMLPGNLLLILYKETKQEKYKLAAQNIRRVFDTYPRTKDGGFWHADTPSRQWQLWADGVFMSLPFLVRYGRMFGDSAYTNEEATKQLLIISSTLTIPPPACCGMPTTAGAAVADPSRINQLSMVSRYWLVCDDLDRGSELLPETTLSVRNYFDHSTTRAGFRKVSDPKRTLVSGGDKRTLRATGSRRPAPACTPT